MSDERMLLWSADDVTESFDLRAVAACAIGFDADGTMFEISISLESNDPQFTEWLGPRLDAVAAEVPRDVSLAIRRIAADRKLGRVQERVGAFRITVQYLPPELGRGVITRALNLHIAVGTRAL